MNWEIYRQTLDQYSVSDDTAAKIVRNAMINSNTIVFPSRPKRFIKRIISTYAAATVVVIVATIVFFNHNYVVPSPFPTESEKTNPLYSESTNDDSNITNTTSHSSKTNNNSSQESGHLPSKTSTINSIPSTTGSWSIVWNEVNTSSAMMYKDPNAKAYSYSFKGFIDYIGYDPTPEYLPDGYNKDYSDIQNLYFDPNGKPTDYYSFYTLNYSSETGSVAIRIGKSLVDTHSDVPIHSDELKSTTVDGIKIILMKNSTPVEREESKTAVYMSSFSMNDVNYYAYTSGDMTANDFINVITSLKQ